jgi:uncharacterized protein YozE (UPF0346 family)
MGDLFFPCLPKTRQKNGSIKRKMPAMKKSFFQFLMKFRDPETTSEIGRFANDAYNDHAFPRHSSDYDEISTYLELDGTYLPSMALFDQAWELYLETENK